MPDTRPRDFSMRLIVALLLLTLWPAISGCGPEVPREELGKVVFDVPKIGDCRKKFQMPPAKPAPGQEADHEDEEQEQEADNEKP
jgi:hypothetical protein